MAKRRRQRFNVVVGKQSPWFARKLMLGGKLQSEAPTIQSALIATKRLTDKLMDILDQFEDASDEIMLNALQPTKDLADYYCPMDTGALRGSGYLEVVSFRGKPRVEIGYGKGGKPEYASFVHEDTTQFHKAPTRSKWLQAAIMEDLPNIQSRLEEGYRQFMNV